MIGIDIASIPRIRKAIESEAFVERVFTLSERNYCDGRGDPAASYAGLFCAKEAAVKALKRGFGGGIMPTDIEIGHDDAGAPTLCPCGKAAVLLGEYDADVSISHDGDYAVATVVLTPINDGREL